ncbi:MAG: FtsW/RodA/SpoVE family cell cycle protein [Propionibacteriaceae bacterium]|jgi:cell division protein FtsW|nr:FtsW/RodA/SpoVE family cell cycle protein [Propionibacteriaceae bacterium]
MRSKQPPKIDLDPEVIAGAQADGVNLKSLMMSPVFTFRLVLLIGLVLVAFGLLEVSSASSVIAAFEPAGDPFSYFKRQAGFAGIGLLGAAFLIWLPEIWLKRLAFPAILLAMILIGLTIGFGAASRGNNNWLPLPGGIQFQPSEFAKLALVLLAAYFISRAKRPTADLGVWIRYIVYFAIVSAGIALQGDIGTVLVLGGMLLVLMIGAGAPGRLTAALGGVAALGVGAILFLGSRKSSQDSRLDRIYAWLHPEYDQMGRNLQQSRSLQALASGGLTGEGIGGSHLKWGLLADGHTDFIFSIIGEEVGFVGVVVLLALFAALIYAGLRLAVRSASAFSRVLSMGVVAWIGVQTLLNIAVCLRWLPGFGVTLPLISYGGSSLIATMWALGLLAGCAYREGRVERLSLTTSKPKRRIRSIVGVKS